ncbi:hypothetical protein CG709_12835, partial [Lachnotalea glycerini]
FLLSVHRRRQVCFRVSPFTGFSVLSQLYSAEKYITSGKIHDFDRDETAASTLRLLNSTIQFLDKLL